VISGYDIVAVQETGISGYPYKACVCFDLNVSRVGYMSKLLPVNGYKAEDVEEIAGPANKWLTKSSSAPVVEDYIKNANNYPVGVIDSVITLRDEIARKKYVTHNSAVGKVFYLRMKDKKWICEDDEIDPKMRGFKCEDNESG
jgi:hypothetical protein